MAKTVAVAVAHAESLEFSVTRERALSTATADMLAAVAKAGVVSAAAATSILDAAESEAKHVAVLAAEETADAVVVAEACANSVATAAEIQAVAAAAAVASASKAVEIAASTVYDARMATKATAVAAAKDARGDTASPSLHRNHRYKLERLTSFIIHRVRRERVLIRRELRATRIILTILGRLDIILPPTTPFAVVFILCWLPHFTLAIYRGLCARTFHEHIDIYLTAIWLGYAHSRCNPFVSTGFSAWIFKFKQTKNIFCSDLHNVQQALSLCILSHDDGVWMSTEASSST